MALTVTVLSGKNKAERAFRLTFDAPRIVVGRSDGCEVRLPDPSVSLRHASIRARGAEYLVVDENSKNGTLHGNAPLPPLSPQVLKSGDRVRFGRIWLEFTIGPPIDAVATPAAARGMALALVRAFLIERGEPADPIVRVVEGPDAGKTLPLEEVGRMYVLGRAAESHLVLEASEASRRHVGVTAKPDRVVVQDLGSKAGATLDGSVLGQNETVWRPGQALQIGSDIFALVHGAAEALAEIERGPDEIMSARERAELDEPKSDTPPPASEEPSDTPPFADDFPETPAPPDIAQMPEPKPKRRSRGGWSITDAAVVLLALGVLLLSFAGWWLLGK